MKQIFFCLAFAAAALAASKWHELHDYSFEKYVNEFGKQYSSDELSSRKALVEARLQEIRAHNSDPSKTWKMGVNHLTDRTHEELKQLRGYKYVEPTTQPMPHPLKGKQPEDLPKHVDWREKHVVTAVKDQGMCGSCWTFGTVETIEAHAAIASGNLAVLSEQQILDCTPNPDQCGGSGGCNGGTAELAMAQIMKTGGLQSEWTYPYMSYFGNNQTCNYNKQFTVVSLTNYTVLPSNKYLPVIEAVAEVGPLIISVDASAWSAYENGVFDSCNQTNPDIDHAVQLVGYGTDPVLGDYWLVRNSWSPAWGENGYIRLRRTQSEETRCGTDINPSDGNGCKNGPPTVEVCGTCGILFDVSYPIIATK